MPISESVTMSYKTEKVKDSVKLTVAFEVEDTGKLYLLCGYLENYELEMLMSDIIFKTVDNKPHHIIAARSLWKNLKEIGFKDQELTI